jgi:hypothetical protein
VDQSFAVVGYIGIIITTDYGDSKVIIEEFWDNSEVDCHETLRADWGAIPRQGPGKEGIFARGRRRPTQHYLRNGLSTVSHTVEKITESTSKSEWVLNQKQIHRLWP